MAIVGDFGSGLGAIIGGEEAKTDLSKAMSTVNMIPGQFGAGVAPYTSFGTSFLAPASTAITDLQSKAGADPNLNYNTFMQNYQTSPGAKYDIGVATEAQNNAAAARGKLLSGSNLRSLSDISTGIANRYANQAYTNYLAGNSQQFGQLESALGNMFSAIGVGTTASGQIASTLPAQMSADASIAAAQAKNDESKGSGFGSLFKGVASMIPGVGPVAAAF